MKRLAIFCGAKHGHQAIYTDAARQLAQAIVARGIGVVYGGGCVGLMGVVADEVMRLGGEVIGVIPRKLMEAEVGHRGITRLHVVETMHERKAMMADLADGFVALPGGIGTLEEIIEVFTWTQIGYHSKPCALLNTGGFYDPLLTFVSHMVQEGFLSAEQRARLIVAETPATLLSTLAEG